MRVLVLTSKLPYVYLPVTLLFKISHDHPQADVSKVLEVREGPEGLTKDALDAKLLL
jgi:hypothetical protein